MFRTSFDEKNKLWCGPSYKMKWLEEPSLGAKILRTMKANASNVAQVKFWAGRRSKWNGNEAQAN